ncbi:hypothetical protein [Nocardioides zeae]|uniref:Uncharacterized protein n=1 Tax=Nocardioides zeae TaxID=1457234 RepID=A0A6P0HNY6_9ACTN|nr:hypothetical protein [Nocardioides zeae]NEN79947.1 hypothetical protein [Nocardioides zeae]
MSTTISTRAVWSASVASPAVVAVAALPIPDDPGGEGLGELERAARHPLVSDGA